MTTFRIHFETGETVDVEADHPDDARAKAAENRRGIRITKVKIVKEKSDA